MIIGRIVSGGQTGVDRAALDAALALGIECGGWCPAGRLAEDGAIPAHYPLRDTPTAVFGQRTEWNVRDSDATLILTVGTPTGGTAHTIVHAQQLGKPYFVLDIGTAAPSPATVAEWFEGNKVRVLNVAGPRESKAPGVYRAAKAYLMRLLSPS